MVTNTYKHGNIFGADIDGTIKINQPRILRHFNVIKHAQKVLILYGIIKN